jgi:hypothetical protein
MMTSGRPDTVMAKASSPVAASSTVNCPDREAFKKRRMGRSSSTTNILIAVSAMMFILQ